MPPLCFCILQGQVILTEEKFRFASIKVKVKLLLPFMHQDMREYSVEVWLYAYLNSKMNEGENILEVYILFPEQKLVLYVTCHVY
jgi:hypothetical protein